ncbi:DUF1499 domain-containing protein [Vibrio sp. CK2-1]|uniref:DUF1499 domain-containing protein n=1 Tax=Vibrio sp. CK2-1 TaxID=2912249 RepID=UPI001F3A6305|nr:DUF1499 domain-containing protein [Vibrio sp. CK2-1]MCF7352718.1 DUF1499 domain-containing protein [Vibrio sp. CK2-1]
MESTRSSHFGTLTVSLAIIALLGVALMIFGAGFDLWEPIVGFGYIRNYLNPIGLCVLGLGVLVLIYYAYLRHRRGVIKSFITVLIGLGLVAPMVINLIQPPKRAPAIHDITTDIVNPPKFLVLDDTRPGAKNSLIYAGEEVSSIQQTAYPYIKPITSTLPAIDAYKKALVIAHEMGWEIVAKDEATLRFEGIAQTPFFSFKDDVVVRVTPLNNQSKIDLRSVSRIGRGDRGVNAARIVDFTQRFNN